MTEPKRLRTVTYELVDQSTDVMRNLVFDGRKWWIRFAVFWGECYFARRGFWRTDLGSDLKGWSLRLGSQSLSGRKLTILLHWHPSRTWNREAAESVVKS